MRSIALLPSVALLAGICAGIAWESLTPYAPALLVVLFVTAAVAWVWDHPAIVLSALTAAYVLAGVQLGASAARAALDPPVRSVLDDEEPITLRARLVEDAAIRDFGASIRAEAEAVVVGGAIRGTSGGVRLTVSGSAATQRVGDWRAGRLIEAPATFRRAARYLNDGVPDFERELALDGIAVLASVKSGLLVDVVERGSDFQEAAAEVRAHVRAAVARHVSVRDRVAGAIAIAILIGDRTSLPDVVRNRLQAAGTYHVIAISGGNIAILAVLMAGVLMLARMGARSSALSIIVGLTLYASIVSSGPSVWRATTMAMVYLAARLLDHRSPPWNAMAVSAALLACVAPLDLRDAGFVLTFGATAAILEAAHRVTATRSRLAGWALAIVAASLAAEIVLLPIGAMVFSRATAAGLVLNLIAVPLMTVIQLAGLLVVGFGGVEWIGAAAGAVAAAAARGLVDSARLVDFVPWLTMRVPPPGVVVVVGYYVALGCALWARRGRPVAIAGVVCLAGVILTGAAPAVRGSDPSGRLRLTMFDVGQGDALLLQTPSGRALMVDAGGVGFAGNAFDIGGRVLAPALWARGVRRLDALVITHGDPDHIGGASAVLRDFRPAEVWEGIPVPTHLPMLAVASAAAASRIPVRQRLAGSAMVVDGTRIRLLHPPPADWERRRVRNDDSLVIEVRFGDVAMLLTGDISAEVEAAILPQLSLAPIRILKVAHHGSRTSTSRELLDRWKPQIALISCGRQNRFGHPAPEVIRRLELAGTRIYRTDRDGQITVATDGAVVRVRTFVGRQGTGALSHEDAKLTKIGGGQSCPSLRLARCQRKPSS